MKRKLLPSNEPLIDYGLPSMKKRKIYNSTNRNNICRHWMNGYCKLSHNCKFLHESMDSNSNNHHNRNHNRMDTYFDVGTTDNIPKNNDICRHWRKGYCKRADDCNFLHPVMNDNNINNEQIDNYNNWNYTRNINCDNGTNVNIPNVSNSEQPNIGTDNNNPTASYHQHNTNNEPNVIDLTDIDDSNNTDKLVETKLNDINEYNESAAFHEMSQFINMRAIKDLYCTNAQLQHNEKKDELQEYISSKDMIKLNDQLIKYMTEMYDLRRTCNYLTLQHVLLNKQVKEQTEIIKTLVIKADKYDTIRKLTQEITDCGYKGQLYTSFCKDIANNGECNNDECKFAHSVESCALKDIAQDLTHHLAFLPNVAHITDELFWSQHEGLKKSVDQTKMQWMKSEYDKRNKKKK